MTSEPSQIGKYRIERRLGQGGMGTVYLAHDTRIGRHVAIKLLRVDDVDTRQRFEVEAQSAGRLKHANIVTVYDYADYEGNPCLVMEYVEGDTVATLISRPAPLSVSRRLELMEQVCRGLGYAHRAGIVHRDIKPSNLMLDGSGVMKVLDFGIARTTEHGVTRAGHVVGTAAYMAPEQVRGERVDARCDIFAVGLVLYEFLTGNRAFPGDNDYAIYHRILNGTFEPFATPDARLTAAMAPIFDMALAKDVTRRYQDVEMLAADLSRVRRMLPPEATESTTIVTSPRARPATAPSPLVLTPPVVPATPVAPAPTPEAERPSDPRSAKVAVRPPWEPSLRPVTPELPLTPGPSPKTERPTYLTDGLELPLRPETPAHPVAAGAASPPPTDRQGAASALRSPMLLVPAGIVLVVLIVAGVKYFSPAVPDPAGRDSGRGTVSGEQSPPPLPPDSRKAQVDPPPGPTAALPGPPPPAQPLKQPQTLPAPPPADARKPKVDPRTIDSRLAIAARLFEAGQYDRAIVEYEAILKQDPRNATAAELLANARSAKAAQQKALLASHITERVLEGQRLYEEGRYDEAIAVYQGALRLDPNDERALAGIALARLRGRKP